MPAAVNHLQLYNNEEKAVKENTNIEANWFPEVGAGGFTSLDGTIEFYTRINALLAPDMAVLDFGGGAVVR